MIRARAMAARIARARMSRLHLTALRGSVERACGLAARSQRDRKAAAHAEIFCLPGDVVDDPLLAPRLTGGARHVWELMVAVGRAADGMIVSWASDGTGAALEMEEQRWRWKGTCGACSMCGTWRCRAARRLRARKRDDGDDQ